MRNCEKSLRQALANGIYKLLQKWAPGECLRVPPRPFCMPVRTISMRAMQVMVDMVMDLLDRIAREAASILELERKDTLTVDAINTAAKLVCRDGKDRRECMPSLPGDEPRALCLIKVHSIHDLDTQYMSSAPLPRTPLPLAAFTLASQVIPGQSCNVHVI